jgi:hypothetical protein
MKRLPIVFASLLLVIVATGVASADYKAYPGSHCVASGTNQNVLLHNIGWVENTSIYTTLVYCPAVQDSVTSHVSGSIGLWDRHYNENFHCELRIQDPTRFSYFYSSVSTSGTTSAPQMRIFGGVSIDAAWQLHYIACLMPGIYSGNRSVITTYQIIEG